MFYKIYSDKISGQAKVFKLSDGKYVFFKDYKSVESAKSAIKRLAKKDVCESLGLSSYKNSKGQLCWE